MIKVGMVGLGLAATSHFKGYACHPHTEVVAVCDLSHERAEEFAQERQVEQVFTSYETMLEEADIQVVDLATPTFLHGPMTRMAAEAGKHVHCEKPFCRSVGEGLMACRAVADNGVRLVVGETYVFLASHVRARELIEAGEIGRPLQIRQRHGPWMRRKRRRVRRQTASEGWRMDGVKSGGGDYPWIFDHAVHFFAAAEFFMLDQKIAEVYSVKGTCRRRAQRRGGSLEASYAVLEVDIPIISWTFEDSDCQGVWMRAEPLNGKFDFMHGFSTQIVGETGMIEVLGEGGHNLIWEGEQQHLVLHREGKETQCFRFEEGGDDIWDSEVCYYSQGHINQVHHLMDCILEDRAPMYGGQEGTHAVRCTLAAIHSAKEGCPVRVEEIGEAYTAY